MCAFRLPTGRDGYQSEDERARAGGGRSSQLLRQFNDQPKQSHSFSGSLPSHRSSHTSSSTFQASRDAILKHQYVPEWATMDAWTRHQRLMSDYIKYYGGSQAKSEPKKGLTDADIIRQEYRFIRTDADNDNSTFEKRLSKKYYDQLYKEYALADMTFYKDSKIGLRWRSSAEVVRGKGQFECGNKKCSSHESLRSYEMRFGYQEAGEYKQTLVKLRLCPNCAYKLNYKKIRELEQEESKLKSQIRKEKRKLRKEQKKERKKRRKAGEDVTTTEDEISESNESESESEEEEQKDKDKDDKKTTTSANTSSTDMPPPISTSTSSRRRPRTFASAPSPQSPQSPGAPLSVDQFYDRFVSDLIT